MMTKSLIATPLFSLLLMSCISERTFSEQNEFINNSFSEEEKKPPREVQLELFRKIGLNHKITRYLPDDNKLAQFPYKVRHLDIEVIKPSKEQFYNLVKHYNSESTLEFVEGKTYRLEDFLPRFYQATLGLSFSGYLFKKPLTQNQSFETEKKYSTSDVSFAPDSILAANCLSTAYEAALGSEDHFRVWLSQDKSFWNVFRVPQSYIEEVDRASATFGDVLAIVRNSDKEPVHAAVFIDKNVFFEKSGFAYNTLYRLALYDDVRAEYPEKHFSYRWLRFNRDEMPMPETFLPNAKEVDETASWVHSKRTLLDKIKSNDTYGVFMRKVAYALNVETMRYEIEEDAFTEEFFTDTPD